MWLAQRERGVAGGERDRLAHHLVGGAAKELQIARQRQRVGAALFERLADVHRFELRQVLGGRGDALAQATEQPATLGRGEPAPGSVERGLRRGDRGVDVDGIAARDARQVGAVRRVEQRQGVARRAFARRRR